MKKNNIPVCLSILAVIVSLCGLIYQFFSDDDQYLAFFALLISNITVLVATISTNKNKKDTEKKEDKE